MLKRHLWLPVVFLFFAISQPAAAEHRFLVRTSLSVPDLQLTCLLHACSVVRSLDGTLNQLYLVTTSDLIDPNMFLGLLRSLPGIVDAELDQLLTIGAGLATLTTPPPELLQTTSVSYYGVLVWQGYAVQPAAQIIRLSAAQNAFGVTGAGIIAYIDTGVDPNHPVLYPVLMPGYDFTRNHPGGSEMNDLPAGSPDSETPCASCTLVRVNQHSVAIMDQHSIAIVDQHSIAIVDQHSIAIVDQHRIAMVDQHSIAMVDQHSIAMVDGPQYAAFGHGTMVAGVLHLVAPTAAILPLKAFHADGTGYLSDIVRGVYYAVANGASVINMSFDFTSPSQEMQTAISYANRNNVICGASVGNDGQFEITYPASMTTVMGVASTSDLDRRSTFSNYGPEVWVAAPGENIVTTYPFGSYAAASGTSFSAPFVSAGADLLRSLSPSLSPASASQAIAHANQLTPDLGNGRLNLYLALSSVNP
jgi:subtilisin family serine protease